MRRLGAQNPAANVVTIRPTSTLVSVVWVFGTSGNTAQVTPTLDGFTISGGGGGNHGGGVRLNDSDALVVNNIISGNIGYLYGGGIFVQRGAPHILNNRIENNRLFDAGADGAGVELEGTRATLSGNLITGNIISSSSGFGGGIAVLGGGPVTLANNTIRSNVAAAITGAPSDAGHGGGVYVSNAAVDLTSNTIISNQASGAFEFGFGGAFGYGGGIYLTGSPAFTLSGNTVANNSASYRYYVYPSGGGIQAESSRGALSGNIISGNQANANVLFGNGAGLAVYTSTIAIQSGEVVNNRTSINCEGYGGAYRFDIGADEFTGIPQTIRNLNKQPADFTLIGPGNPTDNPGSDGPSDWIGNAVGAGDINADGKADLWVGAPNLSGSFSGGTNDDGRTFALYNTGARRLGVLDLYTTSADLEVRSWLHQQHLGQAFANGDLNGDGKHDLIIGASGAANFNVTGTVFIFTGSTGLGGVRTLSPTMQANIRIRSDQNTQTFGDANTLASGQLNGTGPDDLVVGEAGATVLGRNKAGAVYVFFGGSNLPTLWDMRVLSPSLSIYGSVANGELGRVAIADVNGDGKPDLLARSATTVYVFYGPLSGGVIDLLSMPASLTIGGLADGRLAAGDVDGDGKADIIVGDGNRVMVIRGSNGTTLATFNGLNASALLALDWNGDGKAEVVMGDRFQEKVFVVNGSAILSGTQSVFDFADTIVSGEDPNDQFGFSLAGGDLDDDGALDLIIGSRSHGVGDHPMHFEDAGAIYVLYGNRHPEKKLYLPAVTR